MKEVQFDLTPYFVEDIRSVPAEYLFHLSPRSRHRNVLHTTDLHSRFNIPNRTRTRGTDYIMIMNVNDIFFGMEITGDHTTFYHTDSETSNQIDHLLNISAYNHSKEASRTPSV